MSGLTTSPSSPPSAIILAAGVGNRLGTGAPKVLLEFGGKTLLERHLAALHANGVADIGLTVGHRPDLIRAELRRLGALDRVALVDNPRYREGSVVSLAVQRERLTAGKPVVLMDGDVLYDGRISQRLPQATTDKALLTDRPSVPGA